MKIPLMPIVIASCLPACNSIKPDTAAGLAQSELTPITINESRNIKGFIYVYGDSAMVRLDGSSAQRLANLNASLYPAYKPVFFRVEDRDRDGLNEIAVLASVSFGATNLCYDVFYYKPVSGKFVRNPASFYCTLGLAK